MGSRPNIERDLGRVFDPAIAREVSLVAAAVETAGRPDYAPTRAFYEARGYRAVGLIPDFYAPGDDQVTFVKYFETPATPRG